MRRDLDVTQPRDIAIWVPLLVGIGATICTVIIHSVGLMAVIRFVRHQRRLGRAGRSFWTDVAIVTVAVLLALLAHLIEIALWAELFAISGEFSNLGAAFYQSAMNYTTLGYREVVMSARWRMLEPLEAADGMLMFGVTTAMVFTIIQRLVQTRFQDLSQ